MWHPSLLCLLIVWFQIVRATDRNLLVNTKDTSLFEFYQDSFRMNAEPFSTQKDSSIINSDNIYEWTPVVSNITVGEQNSFVFNIDPESTGSGFAPTYEILMFLSGNLCSTPNNTDGIELRVHYSFDENLMTNTSNGQYEAFKDGFMEALAISPIQTSASNTTSKYQNLYVVVQLFNSTTNEPLTDEFLDPSQKDVWDYRLSISENDLVFQWDVRSWLDVLDTDHNSALLTTGNVTADAQVFYNYSTYDTSLYDLYVYSYEDSLKFEDGLSLSLCAIKNGPYLVSSVDSGRVSSSLEEEGLVIQKSIREGGGNGVSEYFYITGLNSSTTYAAILTKKIGKSGNLSDVGGVLFAKQYFTTRDTNTCSLIYDLHFCDGVAYSVPTSSFAYDNKTLIAETYDNIAEALFANFSKALQLIPCDAESDARYSPLRTCDDCSKSYGDWVCAVSIPRCTTTSSTYYMSRNKTKNRNKYIDIYVQPVSDYYEILPCIDMCHAIVRDCPSDFGFACPNPQYTNELLYYSYNYYKKGATLDTCNFIGNVSNLVQVE
ncbi:Mid1p NDAI_0A06070 [Naumovozyma dairenensis CBS 421]|uniref:Stretch-activated cation channel Mid1 n=1 Tax=Naumovozyma dairenensis (strain ATCC 10597 / BCRC 20456 / CBS 421 / NBRC 0211 / NRRL Y-12639) TaxID=1071378 RepID=G0W4M4_NAUDC|nr:hypothetical protein NDAI_0A06070 [Naumovozyma dairenensis CBS 421]CCD22762.1 hypothetical protein NDAI_0A06070 [Naumovozyma dairenensis CBS 421]